MLLTHTFTMRGSDVASLVDFRLVVLEETALRTDERTHERTDAQKNSVALAHPNKTGSDVADLVEFRPVREIA